MPHKVVIVGGGVSGLSAAYFLTERGLRPTLIEKRRLGGLIKTDRIRGCLLEAGPDSYLAAKTSVSDLAHDIPELHDQIIGSNDGARRVFVVKRGQLVPLPKGMVMMVPGDWSTVLRSDFLSTRSKIRLLGELLERPTERAQDVSVGQFVEEHFGRELLEYITEPLLSGVYGGDAARLSVRSVLPRFLAYEAKYGSLIKGVREERARSSPQPLFRSFRDGMQSLTDALASRIQKAATVVNAEATAVERHEGGWRVRIGSESIQGDVVILAAPARVSATLVEKTDPSLADLLGGIPYSSAILVTLVYDRSRLTHPLDGFGFLVPRAERRTIAAATWVSTKFPNRTPANLAAVRAFIVGEQAISLMNAEQEHILALVRNDLSRFMGLQAEPGFSTTYCWPDSMPQYVVGHLDRQKAITGLTSQLPGLHLIGNSYDGVGIPDCVRLASSVAQQVADNAYS